MAIIERVPRKVAGGAPKFWRGEAEVLPSGYRVKNMPPVGTVVDRGVLAYADMRANECTLIPTARAIEPIAGTTLNVAKGHSLYVGAYLRATVTVTAIDDSNSDKDIITLSETIAGVGAGDVVFNNEKGKEANVVVGAVFTVEKESRNVITLAYGARVLHEIAAPCPPAWLVGGMCLKNNHEIKYINQ